MIRVYFLPVETISGTEVVSGIDLIHDALLEVTDFPDLRMLIMDTTDDEHQSLIDAGGTATEATQEDIDRFHAQVIIFPPDPDVVRAMELLGNPPEVITMPEMWELMRIFGRFRGLCD